MWTKSNHFDAAAVRWPREALRKVKCPAAVIHAAKDQLIPLKHSEALRDDVQGATMVVVEDCGHELPSRVRSLLADTMLANARKGVEEAAARG